MRPFIVSDDLWLCEQAAFLPKQKTLVISDLQLGYEQQLRALGHNVVYEQAKKMLALLKRLLKQTNATRLVINGDLKHEFGRISSQERRDILGILKELQKKIEIIVIRGNHDTITKPLTDELGIPFLEHWTGEGFCCVHGHELVQTKAHTIIIGHLHPAITLTDGVRKERYKCFLIGKHSRKRLVVLPSFSTIVEGTDVLTGSSNTPLLPERALETAEVYVLADEIRNFGTVRRTKRILSHL